MSAIHISYRQAKYRTHTHTHTGKEQGCDTDIAIVSNEKANSSF